MELRLFPAAAVVAMTFGATLPAHADDWKVTGEFGWFGVGKAQEIEKGHFYWVGEFSGTFFNDKGSGSLFHRAGVKCPAFNDADLNNKKTKSGGYCVITDTEGDQAYLTFRGESPGTATFDYTGGTGKYKGISGSNTYVGHTQVNWKDGTSTGYATWNRSEATGSSMAPTTLVDRPLLSGEVLAWKLVMRKLPDGTTLVPPAVIGASTTHNGLTNLNVFWRTPEGKPASYARISTAKMSDTEYSETLLFTAFDDGSGKAPTYNLTGSTESVPVTREGSRVAYKLPFGEPSVVVEGDKFTATVEGQFIDYWERVR